MNDAIHARAFSAPASLSPKREAHAPADGRPVFGRGSPARVAGPALPGAQPQALEAAKTLETQARERVGKGLPAAVQAPEGSATKDRLTHIEKLTERARLQADVDISKKGFVRKLWGLAASTLQLAAAVAATVATGGLAAPFLALSCISMAVSVGDIGCAWMVMRNAQARQDNKEPPYKDRVPMGANSLANLAHALLPDEITGVRRRKIATSVAAVFKVGLAAASFATGLMSPLHLQMAAQAVKTTAICMKLLLNGYTVHTPQNVGRNIAAAHQLLDRSLGTDKQESAMAHLLLQAKMLGQTTVAGWARSAVADPEHVGRAELFKNNECMSLAELTRRTGFQFDTAFNALQGANNVRSLAEHVALDDVVKGLSALTEAGVQGLVQADEWFVQVPELAVALAADTSELGRGVVELFSELAVALT